MNPCTVVVTCFHLGLFINSHATDWPTFAHDNQRTSVTDESLVPPLNLQWIYEAPARPAAGWSLPVNGYGARKNKSNVSFDDSHPAIIVGDTVYFSSSAENRVYAIDAGTGTIRWTFFTGAAPRLAPTYWNGNLYFGADDGRAYCLNARTGEAVWTFNAAPTPEQMLGYGRFSSVWPIRAGIMIEDGVAYFTAGLFPSEGVYLFAVNPSNGKLLWQKEVNQSSNPAGHESLAPQGYPLAGKDSIFITSRISPARFSKTDGRSIPFATPFPIVPRSHEYRFYNGGDYAQLWDGQQLVFGRACLLGYNPDEAWTNRYRKIERGQLVFNWFNARQTALKNDVAYFATDYHVLAIDRARLPAISRNECLEFEKLYKQLRVADRLEWMEEYDRIVAQHSENHPRAVELRQTSLRYGQRAWDEWLKASPAVFDKIRRQCRWMTPLEATESFILAGNVLYAGGENQLHALDASSGKLLWSEKTGSRVRALAAANGRLLVSTIDGNVRCYATTESPTQPVQVRTAQPADALPFPDDKRQHEARKLADQILSNHRFKRGYALIIGDDGRLADELARRTGLTIQLLVREEADLREIRTRIATTGRYGNRITAIVADSKQLPFAPYLFNLVVDRSDGSSVPPSEMLRVTRPLGGVAIKTSGKGDSTAFTALENLRATDAEVSLTNGIAIIRRGKLPGTRDWSHNYASPANTYSSEDTRVKGPFGILWYGEPGPRERIDRHATGPMPLIVNGILYTIGYDRVMAYDTYNGVKYWERHIPGATRLHLPIGTSNIAADPSGLFIVIGDTECWHLDALSGKTLNKFTAPKREDGSKPLWGWLARHEGMLFGSRGVSGKTRGKADQKHSDELFALNTTTGALQWQRRIGLVEHDGIAIGDDMMFYVDQVLSATEKERARQMIPQKNSAVPERRPVSRRGKPIEPDLRKLVALDMATGKPRWEIPFDASDITLDDNALLDGRSAVSCMVKDGMVVVHGTGSLGHPHREFLAGEFARRALYVFSSKDGSYRWGGRKGYRKRPIIVGDYVYAEPFAWNLKTGEPKTITNPLSGEPQAFDFHRGYIGCSHVLASGATLFGNKDGIGYCNLDSTEGFSSFNGLSLACGLNATPANGVFVAPEGRSGCTCSSSGIHTSVALYPRTFSRDWATGVAGGRAPVKSFPVKHAYINLGAPGYREDGQRRLWMPYPATGNDGMVGGWLPRYQHDASMFYHQSPDLVTVTGHELPWLFTSGYHGDKPLTFRLQEKGQPAAAYTVTLCFAELEDGVKTGERIFDVLLQGKPVLRQFDITATAGGPRRAITRKFRGVSVTESLTITLKSAANQAGGQPVLCAVAVERE